MFIYYIFRVYIHLGLNHGNSVLLDTKTYWVMRIVWCFILWVYLFFGHPLSSAGGRLTERICSQVVSVFRQILIVMLLFKNTSNVDVDFDWFSELFTISWIVLLFCCTYLMLYPPVFAQKILTVVFGLCLDISVLDFE